MEQVNTDPRVTRTRKLIMESFLALSRSKDFSSITVTDIAEAATINRATFYSHFMDKYDLLEKVVNDKLQLNLGCEQVKATLSLEMTVTQLFISLTCFESNINPYSTGYEEIETIDSVVHRQLNRILFEKIKAVKANLKDPTTTKLARLMTHALIGMSRDYKEVQASEPPADYIAPLLPYILYGFDHSADQ
ncbi:Transcriptional regulator, TetR family [Alkalibacterium sp. AK22]|uniref:TetR family transcriptional regulator n=1 Tax=Alkalibacterium sp. AK22 TaxID=1229520 RepID=UPI0004477A96|nr:TetR family transcriptional regulator [Alkalibacterium sp. AK22]EXJ23229.1 Transcriptional regulator, TetR family [Alkalibacterium sp. AK22]